MMLVLASEPLVSAPKADDSTAQAYPLRASLEAVVDCPSACGRLSALDCFVPCRAAKLELDGDDPWGGVDTP